MLRRLEILRPRRHHWITMRTSRVGQGPAKHFSVSGRHSPCPFTSTTGGIGISGRSEIRPELWPSALNLDRACVVCDATCARASWQPSQAGDSRAHRSRFPRLAIRNRVLTTRPRPQPTGFRGATLSVASHMNRYCPCPLQTPARSTAALHRSPPLPRERTPSREKRNADQCLAAGRMPDCDC